MNVKLRIYDEQDEAARLLEIIDEMEAKIRRGPRPKSSSESQSFYEIRTESFYRACRGMISMARHQLGLVEVKITVRPHLSFN